MAPAAVPVAGTTLAVEPLPGAILTRGAVTAVLMGVPETVVEIEIVVNGQLVTAGEAGALVPEAPAAVSVGVDAGSGDTVT